MRNPKTRTGTCNFVSRVAAVRYYRDQQRLVFAEAINLVNDKIKNKEIVIGKPIKKFNQKICLNTSEGRYFIEQY